MYQDIKVNKVSDEDVTVKLVTEDQSEFWISKQLLRSKSPFFRRLLKDDDPEIQLEDTYLVSDVAGSILQQVLDYLSGKSIYIGVYNALEFAQVARVFELMDLQMKCDKFLRQSLTRQTCCQIYQKAKDYNIQQLQQTCVNYALKRFSGVTKDPSFMYAPPDFVNELLRSEKVRVSEKDLFDVIMEWFQGMAVERQQFLEDFLSLIRFGTMSIQEVAQVADHPYASRSVKLQKQICDALICLATQHKPPKNRTCGFICQPRLYQLKANTYKLFHNSYANEVGRNAQSENRSQGDDDGTGRGSKNDEKLPNKQLSGVQDTNESDLQQSSSDNKNDRELLMQYQNQQQLQMQKQQYMAQQQQKAQQLHQQLGQGNYGSVDSSIQSRYSVNQNQQPPKELAIQDNQNPNQAMIKPDLVDQLTREHSLSQPENSVPQNHGQIQNQNGGYYNNGNLSQRKDARNNSLTFQIPAIQGQYNEVPQQVFGGTPKSIGGTSDTSNSSLNDGTRNRHIGIYKKSRQQKNPQQSQINDQNENINNNVHMDNEQFQDVYEVPNAQNHGDYELHDQQNSNVDNVGVLSNEMQSKFNNDPGKSPKYNSPNRFNNQNRYQYESSKRSPSNHDYQYYNSNLNPIQENVQQTQDDLDLQQHYQQDYQPNRKVKFYSADNKRLVENSLKQFKQEKEAQRQQSANLSNGGQYIQDEDTAYMEEGNANEDQNNLSERLSPHKTGNQKKKSILKFLPGRFKQSFSRAKS